MHMGPGVKLEAAAVLDVKLEAADAAAADVKLEAAAASDYGKSTSGSGYGKSSSPFKRGSTAKCSGKGGDSSGKGEGRGWEAGYRAGKGKLMYFYRRISGLRNKLEQLEEDMEQQAP